jgi:hypothetical protein
MEIFLRVQDAGPEGVQADARTDGPVAGSKLRIYATTMSHAVVEKRQDITETDVAPVTHTADGSQPNPLVNPQALSNKVPVATTSAAPNPIVNTQTLTGNPLEPLGAAPTSAPNPIVNTQTLTGNPLESLGAAPTVNTQATPTTIPDPIVDTGTLEVTTPGSPATDTTVANPITSTQTLTAGLSGGSPANGNPQTLTVGSGGLIGSSAAENLKYGTGHVIGSVILAFGLGIFVLL